MSAEAVPAGLARPGAALLDELERLAATSTTSWCRDRRLALLADLDQAAALLTAARAAVLLAERQSGEWKGHGDPSFEAWRARTSRAGGRAATTELRRAETWVAMPALREAVMAREAAAEHVDVVAQLAASASAPVREALVSDAGQAQLAAMARRSDAGTFARSVAHWAAALDADAHERSHQDQRAARFLHLSDTPRGTRLTGLLDRMAGHRLRLALEAVSPRPPADDDRSAEQRRADALETLADRTLAAPTTLSGAAVRPHVSLVMSVEAWAALRSSADGASRVVGGNRSPHEPTSQDPARGDGSTPTGRTGGGGPMTGPATLEDGTPVPPSEVARVLCDCELTRVVVTADSVPLDLGRTQRTYTGAQRRAVIVRDGGCGWPDCGAQARWCEVHHIRWWDRDGGGTSVDNGVLLCSFHHHEVHRQQLDIRREAGVPVTAAPAGAVGRTPVRYTFTAPGGRVVARDGAGVVAPDPTGVVTPEGAGAVTPAGAGVVTLEDAHTAADDGTPAVAPEGARVVAARPPWPPPSLPAPRHLSTPPDSPARQTRLPDPGADGDGRLVQTGGAVSRSP